MECQLSTVQCLVFTAALPALLALPRGVRGPQGQVVPQQLHDQGAVLVAVLVQSVQLRDGVIKGLNVDCFRASSLDATLKFHVYNFEKSPVWRADRPCQART